MEKNSTLVRFSRYTSGGLTEVNKTALEWWDRTVFTVDADTQTYVVEAKFAGRLDLIAALFLGEPRYWWLIAMINNITDPYSEIKVGSILYIPSRDRAKSLMSGKLGGVESTRELIPSVLPIV